MIDNNEKRTGSTICLGEGAPRGGHELCKLDKLLVLLVHGVLGATGARAQAVASADSVRRDTTGWQERVRAGERRELERTRERREVMEAWRWLPGEREAWLAARARRATVGSGRWSFRANAGRWLTLTPGVGAGWRFADRWSVVLDGAWTAWSWREGKRQYRLWEVVPAIHHDIGDRWFAGLMVRGGEFNYKPGATGRQGWNAGGGVVGGYVLPLGGRFSLEFRAGVGYERVEYREYRRVEGVNVKGKRREKNYTGLTDAGVTLRFSPRGKR